MNLNKAIEINTEHIKISKLDYLPDVRDATKLGIEAMKRLKKAREWSPLFGQPLLPGETID